MSKKVLELLKVADAVVGKIDAHLDKAAKLANNANMHLEFGTEGTKAIYQVVVLMQKKGAKGTTIGDYKNADIPKFLKEIANTRQNLAATIKENNTAIAQGMQFQKAVKALDTQVGDLSKDKAIATNGAAVKLLIDIRKKLMGVEGALADFVSFGKISDNQPKFIDVSEKTKIEDLKAKLPMAFQKSMKDWEDAGGKIKDTKRAIREANFDTSMKLASQLAG